MVVAQRVSLYRPCPLQLQRGTFRPDRLIVQTSTQLLLLDEVNLKSSPRSVQLTKPEHSAVPRGDASRPPAAGGSAYRPRSLAESTAWLRPPATFVVLYTSTCLCLPFPLLSSSPTVPPVSQCRSRRNFQAQGRKKKLSPLTRSPLPRPCPSGGAGADSFRQAGATWCGGLFPRFCATAGLNCPPRLPCQGHQGWTRLNCRASAFRWVSPSRWVS